MFLSKKIPQKQVLTEIYTPLFSQSLTMFTGWQFQQQTKTKGNENGEAFKIILQTCMFIKKTRSSRDVPMEN